jgi:S1-C subfamily serine protease
MKTFKKFKFNIFLIFLTLISLTACATYTYNGRTFSSSGEAEQAQREHLLKSLGEISPSAKKLGGKLKVLIPKRSVLKTQIKKKYGERLLLEQLKFLTNTTFESLLFTYKTVKKYNLFDEVQLEKSSNSEDKPVLGEFDHAIWAYYTPESSGWLLFSKGKGEGQPLSADPRAPAGTYREVSLLKNLALAVGIGRNLKPSSPSFADTPPAVPEIEKPKTEKPSQKIQISYAGTGLMFSSKDYVITNWHVVRGTKNIKVKFLNGEKINAEVMLKDPQNDIAFLELERSPQLPASNLKVGDSSTVRMGDRVFTIGYPAYRVMGQNPKYTEGVVNALSGIKDDSTVFQISVQIQPGNSGGPLFNERGEVIGITSGSLSSVATDLMGSVPQNINYAIKSSFVKNVIGTVPESLLSNRGIVVVPNNSNSRADFIEKIKKNVVLILGKVD